MDQKELLRIIDETAAEGDTFLNLSSEELTSLPPEIGKLTNLKSLHLHDNQLTTLPPEIGKLTNLEILHLQNNNLTSLPLEIGKLTNLKLLYLHNNQLTSLPSEIGNLTNLSQLTLYKNQLTSLPPEIVKLKDLRILFLQDNQLASAPAEIGKLTNLRDLSLRRNQLATLPLWIKELLNLESLWLEDNPLPIPPEILSRNDKPFEIINYYFQHIGVEEKRKLNEAKMLLVGQGDVGKTSIVNRLIDGTFDKDEKRTEKIEIRDWRVPVGDREIKLNVWDFGGQEIMHSTHQFFLTERSLYILVLDARKGEHDSKIDYWLRMIESFGGDSPIIVVVNQIDDGSLKLDQATLSKKYPNIKDYLETSCENPPIGLDLLEKIIKREVGSLEHVESDWLPSWFNVKTKLETMDGDHIPVADYEQMCDVEGIDELSRKTLLRYLHELGIVICFVDDPWLKDKNILNPDWVTGGVYALLNDGTINKQDGVFTSEDLDNALPSDRYPKETHRFIVDMMLKFELAFKFDGDDDRYLIPELLSPESPDINWDYSGALNFQYHYGFMPSSVISRFIARSHKRISSNTYWLTGVLLKYNGNKALVKADTAERKISISISGNEKTRRDFLSVIREHFDFIHENIKGANVKQMVPIQDHPDIAVEYKYLRDLEHMGKVSFVPPRMKERVNVKELLDSLEPSERRAEYGEGFSLELVEDKRWRSASRHPEPVRRQVSTLNLLTFAAIFVGILLISLVATSAVCRYMLPDIPSLMVFPVALLAFYAVSNYILILANKIDQRGFLVLMKGFLGSIKSLYGTSDPE